jgi:hypothetical protein
VHRSDVELPAGARIRNPHHAARGHTDDEGLRDHDPIRIRERQLSVRALRPRRLRLPTGASFTAAPTQLAALPSSVVQASHLAVGAGELVVAAHDNSSRYVFAVAESCAGCTPTPVFTAAFESTGIPVVGVDGGAYFAVKPKGDAEVYSCPGSCQSPTLFVSIDRASPTTYRTVTPTALKNPGPAALAIDETALYIVTTASGCDARLWRLARF